MEFTSALYRSASVVIGSVYLVMVVAGNISSHRAIIESSPVIIYIGQCGSGRAQRPKAELVVAIEIVVDQRRIVTIGRWRIESSYPDLRVHIA